MSLLSRMVAAYARREFGRVMKFEGRETGGQSTEGIGPPSDVKEHVADVSPVAEGPAKGRSPVVLYLHIPFCEQLCPYCSFHRVPLNEKLARNYHAALRKELGRYRDKGYLFSSVYVGGGTPTILPDELEATLGRVRECFGTLQVSVETNPNHLTPDILAALKRSGVNRLSVGIQSFDDRLLRVMNRYDQYGSGEMLVERLKVAAGIFDTLNADMMFNFPSQDTAALNRDLDILLDLNTDQVTYYPLMVSDAARKKVSAAIGRVDYRAEERYYRQIAARLLPAYTRSTAWCFTRPGTAAAIDEYIVQSDEYAGLGSGAIGFVDGVCYANTFDIADYVALIEAGRSPRFAARRFRPDEQMRYHFLMKLFGTRLDLAAMQTDYGRAGYRHLLPSVAALCAVGAVRRDGHWLRLTERGHYLWVVMMREFFTAVNNFREHCRNLPAQQPAGLPA